MSEPKIDIDHLAKLARIRLSEEEKQRLMEQLQSIVGYCSKVVAAKTENLEPLVHAFEHEENTWAEDIPDTMEPTDYLTQNAPEIKENQIVVPKVL
ncbi:MAG: Asp-tRNA(Asn)/Glu-tRNA(Gln) amidotransferase subunit GatC [bacterium]